VNAIFYTTTVWFEHCNVRHHLAECDRTVQPVTPLIEKEAA
jgi:hypothetical protein